jgi:hypothetical protein
MKALITRSDADYKTAVNFQHTFYNFPVTINVSRYCTWMNQLFKMSILSY